MTLGPETRATDPGGEGASLEPAPTDASWPTVAPLRGRPRRPRPGEAARPQPELRWWREVLLGAVFYAVYSFIRNTQGSAIVGQVHALHNAKRLIRLEQMLGLYHERAAQQLVLRHHLGIELWNLFYGTFHFVVTIAALVVLFRRFPERYRRLRNTLAVTTALALIGFATYPLMPPRLLPGSYRFVDTLHTYGSLWSFDSGTMHKISNQYAAMPSLHLAWSLWCAWVLVLAFRRPWAKGLAVLYPVLTLAAVVVTANHYVLDAAGAAVVLAAGHAGSALIDRWREPQPVPVHPGGGPAPK